MPLKAGHGGKFDDRFLPGTYFGSLMRTGETIIGTELRALRARTVRRLPEDEMEQGGHEQAEGNT
eukprot:7285550-Heterocapsa_arctica.AAC.1